MNKIISVDRIHYALISFVLQYIGVAAFKGTQIYKKLFEMALNIAGATHDQEENINMSFQVRSHYYRGK